MIEYIQIDEMAPITNQLPVNFKSAAILLNPFIQMPMNWVNFQNKNQGEHIYPNSKDIIDYGIPLSWDQIVSDCNFNNKKELALSLKTSIGAFKKEYSRPDLSTRLILQDNIFIPSEDSISILLLKDILKVLSSKGASKLFYADPIFGKRGSINLSNADILYINKITRSEIILADENMDFAFISIYDSFITLFFVRDENIENIIQKMNWEAIVCEKDTNLNWYF